MRLGVWRGPKSTGEPARLESNALGRAWAAAALLADTGAPAQRAQHFQATLPRACPPMPETRCNSLADNLGCFVATAQDRLTWAILAANAALTPAVVASVDGWTKVLVFLAAFIGLGYAYRQWRLKGLEIRRLELELAAREDATRG